YVVERAADVDARHVGRIDDRRGDTGRTVEQALGSKLRLRGDTVDAVERRLDLRLVRLDRVHVVHTGVGGVHGELANGAEQSVDLTEAAFGGLDEVVGIL